MSGTRDSQDDGGSASEFTRRPTLKEILAGAPCWNVAEDDTGKAEEEQLDAELERRRKEAEEDNRAAAARDEAADDEGADGDGGSPSAAIAATASVDGGSASAARKTSKPRALASSVASILSSIGQRVAATGQKSGSGTVCDYDSAGAPTFEERAQYTPVRLSYQERKQLHLLEAALSVSGYTDKLDTPTFYNKGKRIRAQLQDICAFFSGLVVAVDYDAGQDVLETRDFAHNADFFRDIFELARRYKIMNPEKLRGDYGKLMYLLQDANASQLQELLEFSCVKKIRTVHDVLREGGGLQLLADPLVAAATSVIAPDGKSRHTIQRESRAKQQAIKTLRERYMSRRLPRDVIEECLHAIADENYLLYFDRDPIDRMIELLSEMFSPDHVEEGYSLAISSGEGGARISHNHRRQFHYVLQSLALWRNLIDQFYRLWYLADSDLLDGEQPYVLKDTGQGLQRIQNAKRVWAAMQQILHETQQRMGGAWVGSSVIHLGDTNVPNALMFIDKYTQVARILGPIVRVIDRVDQLAEDKRTKAFIAMSGGPLKLRKDVLCDFFREGFDGSGGDNFFEAGSCIDGRLTSAWNWCQRLENKPFYPLFKLAGFASFDGKL